MEKKMYVFIVAVLTLGACAQQPPKQAPVITDADVKQYVQSDLGKAFMSDSFKFMQPLLDSILLDDQRYRLGGDAKRFRAHVSEQMVLDSINIIRLKAIVKEYGWLGFKQIGVRSAHLYNVLLHIAKKEDWDYFLPVAMNGYCKGSLASSGLFGFIDRYLKARRELQLFGTEIVSTDTRGQSILYPIYAPLQLEQRWMKYGSGIFKYPPYIKSNYQIQWDAAAHEKNLLLQVHLLSVDTGTATINKILLWMDSCKNK